jgi:hypothetical protein
MLGRKHRSSGVHRAAPEGYVSVENSYCVSIGTCLCIPVQRGMENKASNANSGDSEMRQRISRPINGCFISDLISFHSRIRLASRRQPPA